MAQVQASLLGAQIAEHQAKLADLHSRELEMLAQAHMASGERAKLVATLPMLDERVARRKELAAALR